MLLDQKTKEISARVTAEKVARRIIETSPELAWRISFDYGLGASSRELSRIYSEEITANGYSGNNLNTKRNAMLKVVELAGHYSGRELRYLGRKHKLDNLVDIGNRTWKNRRIFRRTPEEMAADAYSSHLARGIVPPAIVYSIHLGETEEEHMLRVRDKFTLPNGRIDAKSFADHLNDSRRFGNYIGRKPRRPIDISKFFSRIKEKERKPI